MSWSVQKGNCLHFCTCLCWMPRRCTPICRISLCGCWRRTGASEMGHSSRCHSKVEGPKVVLVHMVALVLLGVLRKRVCRILKKRLLDEVEGTIVHQIRQHRCDCSQSRCHEASDMLCKEPPHIPERPKPQQERDMDAKASTEEASEGKRVRGPGCRCAVKNPKAPRGD